MDININERIGKLEHELRVLKAMVPKTVVVNRETFQVDKNNRPVKKRISKNVECNPCPDKTTNRLDISFGNDVLWELYDDTPENRQRAQEIVKRMKKFLERYEKYQQKRKEQSNEGNIN